MLFKSIRLRHLYNHSNSQKKEMLPHKCLLTPQNCKQKQKGLQKKREAKNIIYHSESQPYTQAYTRKIIIYLESRQHNSLNHHLPPMLSRLSCSNSSLFHDQTSRDIFYIPNYTLGVGPLKLSF